MSTSPPSVDPLQSTQKQLDELETLIQRMLKLPVNQVAEQSASDAQGVASVPVLLEQEAAVASVVMPEAMEVTATVAGLELPDPVPGSDRFDFVDTTATVEPPRDLNQPAHRPEVVKTVPRFVRDSSRVAPEPAPRAAWWLWLLIRINRAFDRCTSPFGYPGRRLRSESGRTALGWAGFLMLAAALVWGLLDWIRRNW